MAQQGDAARGDVAGLLQQRLLARHGLVHPPPALGHAGLQRGVLGHGGLQGGLRVSHLLEVLGLGQAQQLPAEALVAVLDAVDGVGRNAPGLGRGGGQGLQRRLLAVHGLQLEGDADVPRIDHLRVGLLAVGGARMARDEGQLTHGDALGAEGQEGLGVVGLAVLVDTEQGEVQVVARVGVVVGIAAKGRDLQLRGGGEAHVRELLVAVEPVFAALVEGHGLAGEARLRLLGLAQVRQGVAPGGEGVLVGGPGLHGAVHPRGDILGGHQHHQLEARHLQLLLAGGGGDPVPDQIGLGTGDLGDGPTAHVVVGDHQAVAAHEGPGAAREAHRGELQGLQPGGAQLHPVLRLDLLHRDVVEGPHPLVSAERRQGKQQSKGGKSAHGNSEKNESTDCSDCTDF